MANPQTHHELTTSKGGPSVTHVRYRVVAFAMMLAAVTYLDRVCISIVAPNIMRDLRLTHIQMSYVFSAFTLAYALFEIPTAWWADRVESRRVLTRIVLWWSAFTMATAAAFNYAALLILRFSFGIGEAGAWPNVARVFTCWIPAQERGRAQGGTCIEIFYGCRARMGAGAAIGLLNRLVNKRTPGRACMNQCI
jgi:MFS transporter, ACS family, glucarate transporter